jgi:hypothetical protein
VWAAVILSTSLIKPTLHAVTKIWQMRRGQPGTLVS